MPTVVIANLQSKSIHCEDKRESLLDILLSATDWMHACGAKGRCTTCKGRILHGMDNLTLRTRPEEQYAKLNKLRDDERLTCQAQVIGDVTLEVPKETQLPHLTYSE
ncbi:2Fe-2S iron-sulfur cluster-binding protein [Ekhidna sp.]|uniref:2Fe-2S iron-sulfur cluster-binding protein n=1 Tax=Ekhidna sp. TaxID=2608089 RepID=UPI0032EC240D